MKIIIKSTGSNYTLDISQGDDICFCITATGNFTLSASNFDMGNPVSVVLIQDGSGGHSITLSSDFKWVGGSAPTLTTTASAKDILTFVSSGSKLLEKSRALDVK